LNDQADLLPYDSKFEFSENKLRLGKQLGSGAFGIVLEAVADKILPDEEETIVAVKVVKTQANKDALKSLISELKIMIYLGKHVNIVNLLGAATKNLSKQKLMVIVEYCKFGNIRDFLIKNRSRFVLNRASTSQNTFEISNVE
jgi:FMS-like tyrosine kinase 1